MDVKIRYFKLMSHNPFFLFPTQNDYSMYLCNKRHKLPSNTGIQKNRSNLRVKHQRVIDRILISNSSKVQPLFFNKNPFVLLDRKSINEIKLSILMSDLYFLSNLPAKINIVNFVTTETYNALFSVFVFFIKKLLIKRNMKQN